MAKEKAQDINFLKGVKDDLGGFEDVNASTMAIPFIKLAQSLTPQMKKNRPEYIEGLELGDFFNSVTNEIYGPHIEVVIAQFEHMYIEWLPNRGGFVGYHSESNARRLAEKGNMEFGKWRTKEGNDLVEYYAYYVILVGHESEGPMIMSLTSTGIKTAKALNRQMTTHDITFDDGTKQRAKPFFLVYNVDSIFTTKGDNDYFGYKFVFKTYITEEQQLIVANEREALPDKTVDYAQLGTEHGKTDDDDLDNDL